jgi:hypothetical protein
MWPRHTGDFCMFRVYTGPDGEPADPSEANIPFKPQAPLPGEHQRCEGRRLRHDHGLPWQHRSFPQQPRRESLGLEQEQPSRVKMRRAKLDIYEEFTWTRTNATRIKYASKHAR